MTVSRQVRVVQAVRKNWEIEHRCFIFENEHREPLATQLAAWKNVHRVIFWRWIFAFVLSGHPQV